MSHDVWSGIPPDLVRGPTGDFLPLAGEVNWGMAKFGVEQLRAITAGKGQITGITDTGVDQAHALLKNCIASKDFTGSRYGAADKNGHGSHCTGTVGGLDPRIGVAPECSTVHGKVLSDQGSGAGNWIAAGMRWCVEQGAEIISMSLGSSGQDPTITDEMERLAKQGIWIIAAAGNSGPNTPDVDWPGRSPHCISVAALNPDLTPASFSSAGAKIDTSGAGVDIWSARPGGGYASMSGTSMATPFVAGVLTLFRAGLKLHKWAIPSVYDLRELLVGDSTDIGTPGDDRRTGPGWLTPLLLALNLELDPPPVA